MADQEYALDISEVQEIVQLPAAVSELPQTPHHVLGVISLRDRLLPLVSLRALFGLPVLAYSEQHRIVVTTLPGGLHVGLVTDSVKEVLSVPRAQAEALPGMPVHVEVAIAAKVPTAGAVTPASTSSVLGFHKFKKPATTRTPALVSAVAYCAYPR